MVFSSNVFLFLFLPIFLALYYLTPLRAKSLVILLGSYAFYAWWRVDFLLLFVAVTGWNYWIGMRIACLPARSTTERSTTERSTTARSTTARWWVTLGVAGDVATLGYFKYANFGVENLNALLAVLGMQPFELTSVILPIGVSFYIFQAISYLVDVYRGDTEPAHRFIDFAAFIALFPQLIAGPVLRYKDLADQFVSRTHSVDKFAEGAMRFMQGFVKKVFIADSIAPLADTLFALDAPSGADAWLGMLAYAAQLYFDFSGYSDMAIGLGLMMGFRFVENFNQPYISQSITEFWRRWHISLSGWLRDYLYIPLGGNRQGKVKTYRNVLLTMLLGGIWHGANWTFVFWGLWHGLWLALERACGWGNSVAFNPLRCLFTFLLVLVGWVLFRAESLGQAITVLNALLNAWFAPAQWSFSALYASAMDRLQVTTLIIAYALIVGLGVRAKWGDAFGAYFSKRFEYAQSVGAWLLLPLFAISILKLSAQSYSPFLYFQF